MKKIIGFALLLLIVIIGCNNHKEKEDTATNLTITGSNWGSFEGGTIKIIVQDTVAGGIKNVGESTIKNGSFTYTGNIKSPQNAVFGLYNQQGDFTNCKGDFILEPGVINLDYNPDISKTIISGGKYNEIVLNQVFNDADYLAQKKAFEDYAATLKQEDFKNKVKKNKYLELNRAFYYTKFKKFDSIRYKHPDPYARLLSIAHSDLRVKYGNELDTLENELGLIPEIAVLREKLNRTKLFRENRKEIEIGKPIKDFFAKDITGKDFHLSDVLENNEYVLVEFWASWCFPCRAEIPYMKKAYEKYKYKGFEIVSFSLDHERNNWEKATKEEGIPWINVSDLLEMKSPVVAMYGVSSVPVNYLVDKNGTIVAIKLRREKLEQKLEELFVK